MNQEPRHKLKLQPLQRVTGAASLVQTYPMGTNLTAIGPFGPITRSPLPIPASATANLEPITNREKGRLGTAGFVKSLESRKSGGGVNSFLTQWGITSLLWNV